MLGNAFCAASGTGSQVAVPALSLNVYAMASDILRINILPQNTP
jgi:hypothetical protein